MHPIGLQDRRLDRNAGEPTSTARRFPLRTPPVYRSAAKRQFWGGDVSKGLKTRGILVRAASMKVLAEEADPAYKDIDDVAKVSHDVGIATLVARLVPKGVTKG